MAVLDGNFAVGCGPRMVKVKVEQSHYMPGQAQRVPRKLGFPDFMTTAQDGGRFSALHTGRLYPQGNNPGTHFC